jgi:hypothetical protein
LVREDTRLADRITLTERLMGEGLLVILTSDDTRRDHFLAGSAMQRVWLSAITRELVASVLTQPLHLHEVRAGLIERLELNGYPQLILRLGYPSTVLPVTVRACVRGDSNRISREISLFPTAFSPQLGEDMRRSYPAGPASRPGRECGASG